MQELRKGELTDIIIGTVVNHDVYLKHEQGINAVELARLLNQWGIRITENHARTRLNDLANRGRIDRVSRGRFKGT